MKLIELTQGYYAKVDDSDYSELNCYIWSVAIRKHLRYAVAKVNGKNVYMHRFLMGLKGPKVDHKDGDGLNNCRNNLRHATKAQNASNRPKRGKFSSRYKGVSWNRRDRKWTPCICANGKTIHLGSFNIEGEAAMVYDKAARHYFGEFARTNF
jgi:hypothetical protein